MALRGPEFQLRVAHGSDLQQIVVAAVVELDRAYALRVAAIEAFREAENRRERTDDAPLLPFQIAEFVVAPLRRRLTMIAGDERHHLDLLWIEPPQIAVLDQIVRVAMMPLVADVDADVVEDGGVLEPVALPIRKSVDDARLIEERRREPRDLVRVRRKIVAAFRELDDAAPPHVGVAIRVHDLLAVPRDVVEDEPLAQRQIAQRDFVRSEPLQDEVDQNGARDNEVCAAGLEARHAEPLVDAHRHEVFAQPTQLLRGNAPVPQRNAQLSVFGERDGPKTEDRARRTDDAREAAPRDLIEIPADLFVDVPDELTLGARLERVGLDEALCQPDDTKLEAAA
ncbi:MAG TPA: hypothetical protein VIW45_03495 [Vicinamibacterales bacterium]